MFSNFARNFRYWLPALLWLMVIAFESLFLSSNVTGTWLWRLLHDMRLSLSWPAFERLHHLLRKAGHVCGYGILCVLLFRAWYQSLREDVAPARTSGAGWKLNRLQQRCAFLALMGTLLTAALDEWRQSFDPARTASVRDVGLDFLGGIVFLAITLIVLNHWRSGSAQFGPASA